MSHLRKLYMCCLFGWFLFEVIISYMNVLEEHTSYEENEKEFYATFPSVTICPREEKLDNFTTFDDVMEAIELFDKKINAWFNIEGISVERQKFDLRNQDELAKGFNTTLEETWKTSAVIQYDYQNAIIPCVTLNVPFGPVRKGILNVSQIDHS